MSNEPKKKRPPVFQSGSDSEIIAADPPLRQVEESFDDIIGSVEPESPAEEKIASTPIPEEKEIPPVEEPETDLPKGWNLISETEQDGRTYFVTHDTAVEGTEAFWRKSRAMSHFRWVFRGRWSDALTRADIHPEPRYYRNA